MSPDGRLLIAIDGPGGSGKSTLARALARRFGLAHIDTGAMYRALALKAISSGTILDDPPAVKELLTSTEIELDGDRVILDGRDVAGEIRTREVSSAASKIAQQPEVRAWCVARQRVLAWRDPAGAVMEGRDIGTVVLPSATFKIFLDADLEERANRRAVQSGWSGPETLQKLKNRDRRDMERKDSPLIAAADAMILDTTKKSAEQILEEVSRLIQSVGRQTSQTGGHHEH